MKTVLYNGKHIEAAWMGWLMLGASAICLSAGMIYRAVWLLPLALVLLGAATILLGLRLRLEMEQPHGPFQITLFLLRWPLRRYAFHRSELSGIELRRVGGERWERPSDTWYVILRFSTRRFTVGKCRDKGQAIDLVRTLREKLGEPPVSAT